MKVFVDRDVLLMLEEAAHTDGGSEVGGLAVVKTDMTDRSNEVLTISDIWIPEQVVGGTHADLFSDDGFGLIKALREDGKKLSNYGCWWHSHAGMSCGSSSQDDETLELLAQAVSDGPNPWFLGLILNTKGEYKARITWGSPFTASMSNIDVEVWRYTDEALVGKVKEMMKNVKKAARNSPGSVVSRSQKGWQGGTGYTPKKAGESSTEQREKAREGNYKPGDKLNFKTEEHGNLDWVMGDDDAWHYKGKNGKVAVPSEFFERVIEEKGVTLTRGKGKAASEDAQDALKSEGNPQYDTLTKHEKGLPSCLCDVCIPRRMKRMQDKDKKSDSSKGADKENPAGLLATTAEATKEKKVAGGKGK